MYEFDSFFTLTPWERGILASLSLALAALCLGGVWWLSRRRIWPVRIVVAALVFVGFVWASPQAYYTYYRMIFDDLPARWVIQEIPTLTDSWGHLSFTGRSTLSSHSKGVLGWALMGVALLAPRLSMIRGRR